MAAVEFKNITKKFGNFTANDDISFAVKENTVHCILGENGAGKSTLMKVLFGINKPDKGQLFVHGEQVEFKSPHDAINKKIGMLHQHFMLIEDFTVIENVILGREKSKGLKLDYNGVKQELSELIEKYSLGLDPDKKISDISISEQQKVEILKLLYRDSEIIIFDEPTAVLTPIEVEQFFEIIKKFKSEGKTIILITHKLNEVKEVSDKVSVLRKGKLVYETEKEELDVKKLSREIVGEVSVEIAYRTLQFENYKDTAAELINVSLVKNKFKVLRNINLEIRKGEIHGIAGVEGNGQSELTDVLFGLEKNYSGELNTGGIKIALVPDDRLKKGMIKDFNIGENFLLRNSEKKYFSGNLISDTSKKFIEEYDIRLLDENSNLGSLSGGNQQKAIVAREIETNSEMLIFAHPTRGVDINATSFIHSKIIALRNSGKAVLLVSSDFDELLNLSDRLSVMYKGKIVKTFTSAELDFKDDTELAFLAEKISKYMLGVL